MRLMQKPEQFGAQVYRGSRRYGITLPDLDDPFINDEHVKFLGVANDEQIAYIMLSFHPLNKKRNTKSSSTGNSAKSISSLL